MDDVRLNLVWESRCRSMSTHPGMSFYLYVNLCLTYMDMCTGSWIFYVYIYMSVYGRDVPKCVHFFKGKFIYASGRILVMHDTYFGRDKNRCVHADAVYISMQFTIS